MAIKREGEWNFPEVVLVLGGNFSAFVKAYGFSRNHVQMWELDHKESWAIKNWSFWIVLEKTLESPLDSKMIKQSILKEVKPEYSLEGLTLKL